MMQRWATRTRGVTARLSAVAGASRQSAPAPRTTRSACPACGGLECFCRPRFFPGQLLKDDDLNALEDYVVAKTKLHNRYLFGWGVVCGLEVVCHPSCDGWITVRRGYALGPCGDDIVVCDDVDVDVLGMIDECLRARQVDQPCAPPKGGRTDCDPDGTWCLTISYEELLARSTAVLQSGVAAKPCGCGGKACTCGASGANVGCRCGGTRGGCACGGSGRSWASVASGAGRMSGASGYRFASGMPGSAAGVMGCGCGGGTAPTGPTPPASRGPANLACEPSRWCEGYRFELCEDTGHAEPGGPDPDSLQGRVLECIAEVQEIYAAMPRDDRDPQALAAWVESVRTFLANRDAVRCDLLAELDDIAPATKSYVGIAAGTVKTGIERLLISLLVDCICMELLPPCPVDDGEELVLACITVRGGRIVHICNMHRRQLVTFPAIGWWLSATGIGGSVRQLIDRLCCGDLQYAAVLGRLLAARGQVQRARMGGADAAGVDLNAILAALARGFAQAAEGGGNQ